MKKITALFAALAVMVSLCGCCMKHSWADATCTEPKTCTKCGATEGEPNGHLFSDWFVESEDFAEMTRNLTRTCSACREVEYGIQEIKLDYDIDSSGEASSEFWTFDNATGTLYINYEGDMPNTYDGRPWDYYSDDIKKIIISDSVTSISDHAFSELFSLSSVTIPGSVEDIGLYAFHDCYELTEVNIGNGVKTIGVGAFSSCRSLKSIVLPDSITNICAEAFFDCKNLSDVSIPPHAVIRERAFGATLFDAESSEFWTFDNATGTLYINYEGDMPDTENGRPWGYYNSDIKKIIISDSVTSICDHAFDTLFSLSSVDIPGSVENIGFAAFCNCYELTEVNIGNGVKTIGGGAFSYCHSLKSIVLPDSITSIGWGAFFDCKNLSDVSLPPHAVIEERAFRGTLFEAESSKFWTFDNATGTLYINYEGDMPDTSYGPPWRPWDYYSDDIKKIIISDSVTSIGDYAFSKLFSLSSVTIPGSVEHIGWCAFSDCYELTEVNIGDGVKTIGAAAFYRCHSLKSIVLPDSITNIGAEAFSGCENLSDVSIPPHAVIEERVFSWTLTDAESDSGG